MGWGYGGVNPKTGEEMGYNVGGVCHHDGCPEKIDHGLAHVCGGMHEGGDHGCGYYFCGAHLTILRGEQFCMACASKYAEACPEDE